ncbi:MAG: cadmium-translocating P-type ATPase, partial [Proteobacteria bacterium]|nr:cadmium-translocating P-type ATPase [Pseudomonadota bacterium]
MDCASCAIGIEQALRRIGLHDASVNYATRTAYISPSEVFTEQRIIDEIKRIGYLAHLPGAATRAEPAQRDTQLFIKMILSLLLSIPLMLHMVVPWHWLHTGWVQCILATPVVLIGLMHFGRSAVGSLRAGLPNMDVLIILGVLASYTYSLAGLMLQLGHEYLFFESAAAIVALVFVGNFLESRASRKAASAIEELSRSHGTLARVVTNQNGYEQVREIPAEQIAVGDLLRVNTGDKVPTDCIIESGEVLVDEAVLTGESLPITRGRGLRVIGGSTVHSGSALLRASAVGEQTVLSGIVRLVKEAQGDKPPIQKIGDIVSAYFTPVVLLIALITFTGWIVATDLPSQDALLRAVAVLVIACPCAMGLATPMAVMVGIGRGARNGILIRGGSALQRLASVTTVIFDKTGTLTTGEFSVEKIEPIGISQTEAQALIHGLELQSSHPIARCLVRALADTPPAIFQSVEERRGYGMLGTDPNGVHYTLGRITTEAIGSGVESKERLALTRAGAIIAWISISDTLKADAVSAVHALRAMGLTPVMISGDSAAKCRTVAERLAISEVYAEQTPEQKVALVEQIQKRGPTAFVGDGINDAPSLALASVGIAMSNGTHLAIESSDLVVLQGSLTKVVDA